MRDFCGKFHYIDFCSPHQKMLKRYSFLEKIVATIKTQIPLDCGLHNSIFLPQWTPKFYQIVAIPLKMATLIDATMRAAEAQLRSLHLSLGA